MVVAAQTKFSAAVVAVQGNNFAAVVVAHKKLFAAVQKCKILAAMQHRIMSLMRIYGKK